VSDQPVSNEAEKAPTPEAPKPAKKGRLKKVALGVVAVAAVVLLIGRAMLPGIIKSQVEEKGTAALGVPVTVGGLGLSVLGGSLTIEDFAIAQPDGFSSQPFYSFDKFHASVSVSDLIGGKISVETVQMDKPVLRLERNAQGLKNYEVLKSNAGKNSPKDAKESGKKGSSEKSEEKEFLLEEFIVRDLQVVMADASAGQITFDQAEYSVRNVHMIPGSKDPSWFTLEWKGLALSGPGGNFKVQKPFTLDAMSMEIDLASLMRNDPHIKSIRVDAPEIRSEQLADSSVNFVAIKELAMLFSPTPTDEAGAIPENERTDTKTEEGGAEVEQAPYRLDLLEVKKGLVVQTLTYDSGPQDFTISGLTVDVRDLVSPAPAGQQSQVTVRMNPLAPDSSVALKLIGNLTSTVDAERDINYDLDVKNFPLAMLSRLKPSDTQIKSGQMDSSIKGSVQQTKVDSEMVFVARDLALEKGSSTDGKRESAWFGGILRGLGGTLGSVGISVLEVPGRNETVPIKVDLEIDYKKQSATQQAEAIERAFRSAFTRAVTDATKAKAEALAGGAIGTVKDAGGAVIGGASDVVSGAGKAAGDVVGGAGKVAGDAVKGVGGALGGLLGGGKKDDEKKDE